MNDTTEPGNFSRSLLEASLFQPISLKAPNAWCGHLPFAAWLIGQVKPDTFVELGTHTGNSYFTFCQSVKENGLPTRCYAIDTWAGDEHAGYYGDAVFHQVYEHNAEHYSGFGRLLRMTFDDGLEYFADGTVGLLHIDGLHTYDAVKHDFDTWLPKLTPGAVVLFHDTNVRENEFGVWRLWKELSEKYPSMEFLHSHGLGVLQIEGGPPEKRLSWLAGPESQKQMLRDYFAALGARQIERFALHDLKQREHVIMAQRNEFEHQLSRMIETEEQAREAFEAERDAIREAAHAAEEADRARIQELEAFVHELLSSKSWRLTAPLRYVVNAFKGTDEKKKLTTYKYIGPGEAVFPEEGAPPVTVIVPVYRDVRMTVECIRTAMPGILAVPGSKLLLINDRSPDEDMPAALETQRAEWPEHITVLDNDSNLGFVATVNRGMRHAGTDDVVLLNNDVVLPPDWLSRLRNDAYLQANIATTTPLSNNTTICTFPDFLQDNPLPFGLDTDGVDAAFRDRQMASVETPTGIGFCMYIKRKALVEVGEFNEERFGRGYGEENDFCQRAIKAGYVNTITPNLFVFHQGGVSFAGEKNERVENANRVMNELHPRYHADVADFIAQDPLKSARLARLFRLVASLDIPRILHVSHGIGGGVDQHIIELAETLKGRTHALILAPARDGKTVSLRLHASKHADTLVFTAADKPALLEALRALGISLVHYHHTMNLPDDLYALGEDLGVPHLVTVHDFYWLNGNPTLTNRKGIFEDVDVDTIDNPLYPLPSGMTPTSWRNRHRPLLETAQHVVFPSRSTQTLFGSFYDLPQGRAVSHLETDRAVEAPFQGLADKKRYTIGVIGAIGVEKGAELLDSVSKLAHRQSKPYEFVLIGYAHKSLAKVRTTGRYEASQLLELMKRHGIDVLFFPARWPETYSYTLSYALASGLAIVAPDVGAFPERLAGRQGVKLFNHQADTVTVLRAIDDLIEGCARGVTPVAPRHDAHAESAGFYESEYVQLGLQSATEGDPGYEIHAETIGKPLTAEEKGDRMFGALWKIYRHPSMGWVDSVVPYRCKRWVKRQLTNKSLQDIS